MYIFLCPLRCLWPLFIQCKTAASALNSSNVGPFTLISMQLFRVSFHNSVLPVFFIIFMWLNPVSTRAVLIEWVSMISNSGNIFFMVVDCWTKRSL